MEGMDLPILFEEISQLSSDFTGTNKLINKDPSLVKLPWQRLIESAIDEEPCPLHHRHVDQVERHRDPPEELHHSRSWGGGGDSIMRSAPEGHPATRCGGVQFSTGPHAYSDSFGTSKSVTVAPNLTIF